MHTNENLQSNNGWQNVGICHKLAIDKIKTKYISIYLRLVEYSFGYCQPTTNRKTIKWWCDDLKISNKTFIKSVQWLIENNFIEAISHKGFIKGGGSLPYAYKPIFPHKIDKKYGHIYLSDNSKEENEPAGLEEEAKPLEIWQ